MRRWRSTVTPRPPGRRVSYQQQLGPKGLKTGVGLVVDLGAVQSVTSVDLTFQGAPTERLPCT